MGPLPILDIAAFLEDPGSVDGRAFVDELLRTEHGIGFCQLVGHGIDPALETRVMTLAAAFFALPEPDRIEIVNTNTPHFRGYTRLGQEHTNGTSDWRDQIDIGPERPAPDLRPDAPAWLRLRGPNQWPSAVPEMQAVVTAWMDAMAEVGRAVLSALALGLGLPADHFEPVVTPDPEVLVKIIRYPAQESTTDTGQGVGPDPDDPIFATYGENWLKFRLRSHPDVAEIWHPDLVN